ncbi:DUF3320 domain-containing protein [Candidatus Cryosericum septentrionale]|jgi:very-short-patch-repair endonuclease/DNA polymerase III delta prime subunit|uniref:DUF3320 domain-containing protein n=1 Tax=Candidatus Cryosericum septentrionale TaxID=2290913 RepID=A0A398DNF6_9BACT|nr:DUF3320 domain-containing protein [Candidatus Cryosericum septentrionale]RIE16725.1 DUF3320 domain-containing protein [Candidatus Cryosericum septentrionale]
MDPRLEQKLDDARRSLLDLTMRNRLLNYRPTKARSLRVLGIDPRVAFDVLVNQEKAIVVRGRTDLESVTARGLFDGETNAGRGPSDDPESSHGGIRTSGHLLTDRPPVSLGPLSDIVIPSGNFSAEASYDPQRLAKRLRDLDTDAQSVVEERGYNVLYLALGFLEWCETDAADTTQRAPAVLVPVRLEALQQGRGYQIVWNGDDVVANVSLQAKLREQTIEMPELNSPETAAELDEYYQSVGRAVSDKWRVVDLVELDFFSFARFSLYRDLDPKAWSETAHFERTGLLRSLLLNEPVPGNDGPGFDPETIDEKLHAVDILHVMDADPSQIAVIEDAKTGRSLVVEGPPGTGKSQTIVNIIAELLGNGKKVLFVSQKMAALDVVKQRLDGVGLGTACLELHSDKATKEHFVDQLRKVLENEVCPHTTDIADYDRVDALRAQLGAYARALGDPVGAAKSSVFALFGLKERAVTQLRKSLLPLETQEFDGADTWAANEINIYRQAVLALGRHLESVGSVTENPWRECEVGLLMPNDLPTVGRLLEAAKGAIERAREAMAGLLELGIPATSTFAEVLTSMERSPEAVEAPTLESAVSTSPEWHRGVGASDGLVDAVRHIQAMRSDAELRYEEGLASADVDGAIAPYLWLCETHRYYETFPQRIGRLFSREYRRAHASVLALLVLDEPVCDRRMLELLTRLKDLLKEREWVAGQAGTGTAYFGSAWKGEDSDLEQLARISTWMLRLRAAIDEGRLTPKVLAAVTRPAGERLAQIHDMEQKRQDARSSLLGVCVRVGYDTSTKLVDGTPLGELVRFLDTWIQAVNLLPLWSEYVVARSDCRKALGSTFVETAESGRFLPSELAPYFDACLADTLLRKAFNEHPTLARFSGASHEAAIEEYVRLDRRIIQLNQHRLARLIEDGRPAILANPTHGSEAGVVRGEINRKRRHRPIRSLMREAGSYIQALKPCFLMSPLSVAQFLDPTTASFDCIIFDEASQVKPEEALGALLRGDQLIVMGDTRQLPPTSFFDRMVSDDEIDDEDIADVSAQDIESILHLCKNALPVQCQKSLLWHYRSRHESLIAVSNREFYENRLRVYPSAVDSAPGLGLSFVHVPDGVYDRGRSRTNRIEAAEVARRVVQHYQEHPGLSLGVGTFNTEQQRAIDDELVLLRETNPQLDRFFDRTNPEHCFVKNIETIQGDERDIIFVSVGYGYDESHGFSQNFGPINKLGGERRLNVLMTRARVECVIFANFQAEMIPADGTGKGLSALRAFLQYAATRTLPVTTGTLEDAESPFEDAVGELLQNAGFTIKRQVGCAHFRVDIGVVDPVHPGRYMCGVECDGATYHSARVARDRDRLRQQILEGLGWHIVRVWSTDWFRDRARVRARLLDEVRRIAEHDGDRGRSPEAPGMTGRGAWQTRSSFGARTGQGGPVEGIPASGQAGPQTVAMRPREVENVVVQPYTMCTATRGVFTAIDLREASIVAVASVVVEVVLAEGPIHETEVVKRVRTLWGFQRAGPRIQEKVYRAINYACSWDKARNTMARPQVTYAGLLDTFLDAPIVQKGEYLWPASMGTVAPRRRDDAFLASIELICDEEILAAIVLILESDCSAPIDGLVISCGRVLGIQAVHDQTRERIEGVIRVAVDQKVLCTLANGNVALVSTGPPTFKVED